MTKLTSNFSTAAAIDCLYSVKKLGQFVLVIQEISLTQTEIILFGNILCLWVLLNREKYGDYVFQNITNKPPYTFPMPL